MLTFDERRDGAVVQNTVNTYDDRGRIQKQVVTQTQSGMTTMYTIEYTYMGDRNTPVSARQTVAQGASAWKYTASADGRMVHVDFDDGDNGSIDRSADQTYDEEGRLLTFVGRTGTDVTVRYAYTYNKRGSELSYVQADNDDSW